MAGHTHGATSGRLLWLSLSLTLCFVVLEFIFGLRSHSLALLSDAGHNASDALALGLAAYAVWVARRPATHSKTFGYHRVAILTALANTVALGLIAVAILIEAIRVITSPAVIQLMPMIIVASIAVVMNTVIAYWLRGESKHSLNVRAVYVHMAGDALSSASVVIAGLLIHFTGWRLADPIASMLIAAFILYTAWGILVDATNVLLEGTPKGLDVDELVKSLCAVPSVINVHDLHIWTVGDGINFLSCHVALVDESTIADQTRVIRMLNEKLLQEFGIVHATIQPEIGDCDGCAIEPEDLYCATQPQSHQGCAHSH